jgi:hypothetical protein
MSNYYFAELVSDSKMKPEIILNNHRFKNVM